MTSVPIGAASVTDAHDPHATSTGLDNKKIAIWAFIGSECMLFASLISTYLIYKGRSKVGPFPHEAWTDPMTGHQMKAILNIPVTSASTFVLLMSSLAMVLALAAVQNKNVPKRTTGERPARRPVKLAHAPCRPPTHLGPTPRSPSLPRPRS